MSRVDSSGKLYRLSIGVSEICSPSDTRTAAVTTVGEMIFKTSVIDMRP